MRSIWSYLVAVLVGGCLLAVALLAYKFGSSRRSDELAVLSTKLAASEKTIEIQNGLFSTTAVQVSNLRALVDSEGEQSDKLRKQLDDTNARLLATQQLAISWKKAYEGALSASQSNVPGSADRKRVDFSGQLGPIRVAGHTLTDPPEAEVSIQQIKPLILTLSISKNPDGTWASYVQTSDLDVAVNVRLAGVDPGAVSPGWKERVWVKAGIDPFGDRAAHLGIEYRWDDFSLGARCGVPASCGFELGMRLFR